MSLKIYNTLTRQKEEFKPIDGNNVKMYACGITVSGEAHIGHAIQAMVFDIVRKYLVKKGYRIDLRKVAGHSGIKGNELADMIATGKTDSINLKKGVDMNG